MTTGRPGEQTLVKVGRCLYCLGPCNSAVNYCIKCWQMLTANGQWETIARSHGLGRFAPGFSLGKAPEPDPYAEES